MQTEVNISPDILHWVVSHIQNNTDVSQTALNFLQLWESGVKTPTFNQVEKVSRATGIPLGYFFLKKPPVEDLSVLEYRTVDSSKIQNPSRNLVDTIHDMERIQDWMREYLTSENTTELQFIGCFKKRRGTNALVEIIRSLLDLDVKWFERQVNAESSFKYIRSLVSEIGVLVMMSGIVGSNTHRVLEIEEFRAFTLVDKMAPLIFINSNDSTNGKLFSILHEFAHILLGVNSFFNDRFSAEINVGEDETLCNTVTAEILVPQNVFLQRWNSSQEADEENKIADLARYFKCGYTVIARKALDNGLIAYLLYQKIAQTAVSIYNAERKKKKEQKDGGDYYRTVASRIDNRFLNALSGSVAEGKTLYTDAFRLTNTNRATFAALTKKVQGD